MSLIISDKPFFHPKSCLLDCLQKTTMMKMEMVCCNIGSNNWRPVVIENVFNDINGGNVAGNNIVVDMVDINIARDYNGNNSNDDDDDDDDDDDGTTKTSKTSFDTR